MLQAGEDFVDVPGIVLAVRVHLDYLDVAEPLGVLEAGPHGTPDAEVEGQVQDGAPAAAASSAVASVEPSLTTRTS